MSTKTSERTSARQRLLSAANELFYREGVRSVGIDRVIERAGVAKASLYSSFGSKDELIRSYLRARREARDARIAKKLKSCATPREEILAVFDVLGDVMAEPHFRGCAFYRASAEACEGDGVREICDDMRAGTRTLFADLSRAAGVEDPEGLAQQLLLVHDGAIVGAQMDRNRGAAAIARTIAASLLDAAIPRG